MIDLHIHSNFSDGTDSIEQIIEKIINKGIHTFAITDHDTIEGVQWLLDNQEKRQLLDKHNIRFVPGIEFSSIVDKDKIHILGYNCDFNNTDFINAIELGWKRRRDKYQLRLQGLKEQLGIEYSPAAIQEMNSLKFVGKPIMANYLVKDGKFATRQEAMAELNKLKLPTQEIRVEANIVISSILSAGGIPVWAHPLSGLGEKRIDIYKVEEIIQKLIPLGIRGMECYYNLYTEEECKQLENLAKKYNLLVSSGSDYHGKNKECDIGEVMNQAVFDATDKCTITEIL